MLMIAKLFFPSTPDPSPSNMNWAAVLFIGLVVFALVYYLWSKRHTYASPAEQVQWSGGVSTELRDWPCKATES